VDQASTFRSDEAGNVLAVSDTSRSGTDAQCFTYDHLRRLTEGWTQPTAECASTPVGAVLGGPAPYWHSYTYDPTGNTDIRTLGNGTVQDLAHDVEGRLAKVTEPVEGGAPTCATPGNPRATARTLAGMNLCRSGCPRPWGRPTLLA